MLKPAKAGAERNASNAGLGRVSKGAEDACQDWRPAAKDAEVNSSHDVVHAEKIRRIVSVVALV